MEELKMFWIECWLNSSMSHTKSLLYRWSNYKDNWLDNKKDKDKPKTNDKIKQTKLNHNKLDLNHNIILTLSPPVN